MNNWYARYPVLLGEDIYFCAGNDLFKVNKKGGTPILCFNTRDEIKNLYAYGNMIACTAYENGGPDIYIFNIETNQMERITYFERSIKVTFMNNEYIEFISNKDSQASSVDMFLYRYDFKTKECIPLNIGPIEWAFKDDNKYFFQKNEHGYISFKGYQGGQAGTIWQDNNKITNLPGNCLRPSLYNNRIYFLYDNRKHGNVCSCNMKGEDLKQITFFEDFYVQDLSINQNHLTYSSNGRIGLYNLEKQEEHQPILTKTMPHPSSNKFITNSQAYLTSIDSDGKNLHIALRGNLFSSPLFSGGTVKLNDDLRYRVSGILNKKQTFAFKEPPFSSFHVYENNKEIKKFELNTGKIVFTKVAPNKPYMIYINHKHELHLLNYETNEDKIIYQAKNRLNECDFSNDGNFLVYSASLDVTQSAIRVYDIEKNEHNNITSGKHYDSSPSFDPSGEFIVFLSNQYIDCYHDGLRFNKAFSSNTLPYLIPLQKNTNLLAPWNHEKDEKDDDEDNKKDEIKKIEIDFDDIASRIIPMPVSEKNYEEVLAIENSKILLVSCQENFAKEDEEDLTGAMNVETYCMNTLTLTPCYTNIAHFELCFDKKHCIIFDENQIKILKSGQKEEKKGYKNEGIFDWSRIKCTVDQQAEWKQILEELWWIIKEFFWSTNMAGLDWDAIWKKYENSANNIRTREELDDLINELQGEVGTSHAFIMQKGRERIRAKQGHLGCNFKLDKENNHYYINEIFNSSLQTKTISPIKTSNADIKEKDKVIKIDGKKITKDYSPQQALCRKANSWITLETENKQVEIKTIDDQNPLLYRNWANANREFINNIDKNIGYIHIPDMVNNGYKEFFQSYLNEYQKEVIIIDVRYNRGGNVGTMILDQLQRKRLGLDYTRHHGITPIPHESSKGNYVLLINENTCSDGEIFTQMFKTLKLGPIIGARTWGGVIGIMPRYTLIDNTLTSQPEFGTFMSEIKYDIENKGITPEIEILNDHTKLFTQENDEQLKKAIQIAQKQIKSDDLKKSLDNTIHPTR